MTYNCFLTWRKDADCYLYDVCDLKGKKLWGSINFYDTIEFCKNREDDVLIYIH